MIYSYGMENKIYIELLKKFNIGEITKIAKLNKIEKLIKEGDSVILFNWGNGTRKFQEKYREDKRIELFPPVETSLLLSDRLKSLKAIDKVTKFPIERLLIEGDRITLKEYRAPKLKNGELVVTKIGNDHQGESKYLKNPGDIVKTKENVVFEEYVDNSRSIRIIIIKDSIFVVEHVNSDIAKQNPETKWIKNIAPIETSFTYNDRHKLRIKEIDNIIEDAKEISRYLKIDFIGVDYVIKNDSKIGFLEANDMIGLPDNKDIVNEAVKYFYNKYKKEE